MWRTRDPQGREVALTAERWSHILDRHPYIGLQPDEVIGMVERPDARMAGRTETEEWYYGRGLGPSAWTRVVVHFERDRGMVVTAFPRRSFP